MPAAKATDPTSLRSRVRLWLLDHPGEHAPRAIADAMGVTDKRERQQLTNELGRLARSGAVIRTRRRGTPAMGPGVTYRLAVPTDS